MSVLHSNQRTIGKEGSLSGVGIHTGVKSTVFFKPAPANTGVRFSKKGVRVDNTRVEADTQRCTSIGVGENKIQTVEHLLAAFSGLGITNILIDVDGPEMPILDGSAALFVKFLKELGIVNQAQKNEVFRIKEPIFCYEDGKVLAMYPAEEFSVAYTLDYNHPWLQNQKVEFVLTPEIFEKEIAPARTFCTEKEAQELKKNGFGLGGSLENTVVISDEGVLNQTLRYSDECARHKVLDILGDLNLLGFPVAGRVVGLRSGHSLNRKLIEEIKKQRGTMETKQHREVTEKDPMQLEEIKKILPHRYPFLLVDRIIEIKGSKAVGIKNLSGNEPFFQGHFPERPVMPGVLMIEALAQVGGVLMLSKSENRGKIAYLVGVNNARFRRTVVPGDQLRLEVEVIKMKSKVGVVQAVASVDGEEACNAEIMFTLVD